MSIDLTCYSSLSAEEVQVILDDLSNQHQGLFTARFLIYKAKNLINTDNYYDSVGLENALEYGLNARCRFSISLNDKSVADLLPTVEAIIKNALGDSNVLILFNNEERR